MSFDTAFPTLLHVRPANTQISLSESRWAPEDACDL